MLRTTQGMLQQGYNSPFKPTSC